MRVAVVGAGVVGLAVSRALMRHGCEVTCFEADIPMGARSAGSSRLFRILHPDPDLDHFARWSRSLWTTWDAEFGTLFARRRESHRGAPRREPHLLRRCGLLVSRPNEAPARGRLAPAFPISEVPAQPQGSLVRDREASVIDVRATSRYLRSAVGTNLALARVERIERATVHTAANRHGFDHVVLAAGQGTYDLAQQAGITTPAELAHHARFTFPLRYREDRPTCWLDGSEHWRPGVTLTQHRFGDDRWTIGVHFADETPWEAGREEAIARAREVAVAYVNEVLYGVGPEVVETMYGTVIPGLADGIHLGRTSDVTAIWGNDLFGHAPGIGEAVAVALVGNERPVIPAPSLV